MYLAVCKLLFFQETTIGVDTAVCRNAIQITICQHALRQWTECDDSLAFFLRRLFQTILLNGTIKNRITVLIDHKRTMQFSHDRCRTFHRLTIIIRNTCIQCFSTFYRLIQSSHGLLQRCIRIHPMMIINIDVIKSQSL